MKKFYLNDEEVREEVFNKVLEGSVDNYCENNYDDWIDECFDEVKIGCSYFLASDILKKLDPIAYRCGLSDYENSIYEDYNYELEHGEEIKVDGDYFRVEEEEEEGEEEENAE